MHALQEIAANAGGLRIGDDVAPSGREILNSADAAEFCQFLNEPVEADEDAAAGSDDDDDTALVMRTLCLKEYIDAVDVSVIEQAVACDGWNLSQFTSEHRNLLVYYADVHIGRGARWKWTFEDLVATIREWRESHPHPRPSIHPSYGAPLYLCAFAWMCDRLRQWDVVSAGSLRPVMGAARKLTAGDVHLATGTVQVVKPWRCGGTKPQRRLKARRMVVGNESAQMVGAMISFSADGAYFCIKAKVVCTMFEAFWDVEYVGKCRAAGVPAD